MAELVLSNGLLRLTATLSGGAIWRLSALDSGVETPILRETPPGVAPTALQSASFPLVPFGNRVRGNRFAFEGDEYRLEPNMPWDRHYLHGDGWTGQWQLADQTPDRIDLALSHRGSGTPYAYDAT